jgi:hypothetical protein
MRVVLAAVVVLRRMLVLNLGAYSAHEKRTRCFSLLEQHSLYTIAWMLSITIVAQAAA